MVVIIFVELYAKNSPEAIDRVKVALLEAAAVYTKDQGTLEWQPIQDRADERKFAVLEKFDSEDVSVYKQSVPP